MNYFLTYILSIILVGTTLFNLAKTRLKTILLHKPPVSSTTSIQKLTHSLNTLHHDEILFYHLLNYQSHK
jgi:predicted phosphohydrolase